MLGKKVVDKIDIVLSSIWFKIFGGIDIILSILSYLLEWKWLLYITLGLLSISAIVILFRFNQICKIKRKVDEVERKNLVLEQHIHNGVRYIKNYVTITFEKSSNLYKFEFYKEYEIISDEVPKWYSAQFYANKILNDKDHSKNYYQNKVVNWNDLGVKALISYKNPGYNDFTGYKELKIHNVTDQNNYIPFHIQYITTRNGVIELKKGALVKLKYCYDVPTDIWGSYINRSISYFSEPTRVLLKHESKTKLNFNISKLSETDASPVDCDEVKAETDNGNPYDTIKIELEAFPFGKYRVWWDAESYFNGGENSVNTADQSQLTNL